MNEDGATGIAGFVNEGKGARKVGDEIFLVVSPCELLVVDALERSRGMVSGGGRGGIDEQRRRRGCQRGHGHV